MSSINTRAATAPLSVLLLADDWKGHANAIRDHIQAFRTHSTHRIVQFNPRGVRRSRFLDLKAFDAVVIHYSLIVTADDHVSPWLRDEITTFDGLKIQFLQDEYRWVDDITAMIRQLGINVLFSVAPPAATRAIYTERLPETEIVHTLTGYVPDSLLRQKTRPIDQRPIDVGYRGRSLPFWLGRLGQEKVEIGRGFLEHAEGLGLHCDIAWKNGARIYGRDWNQFISSCRVTLASESGASIVDADGSAEAAVCRYVADHPTASYDEVEKEVLGRWLHGPVINTSSPRIFEAAAHSTGLVMFPGEYSRIVVPWEHYIPLQKDFSNISEVADRIRDTGFVASMTRRAHEDLIASRRYSYDTMVREFDEVVADRVRWRHRRRPAWSGALRLEETATGRGHSLSAVRRLAERAAAASVGARASIASAPLRRLALLAGRERDPALWGDILRLAILNGTQTGILLPAGGRFEVAPSIASHGVLLLSSVVPPREAPTADLFGQISDLLATGNLAEIIWNHAPIGQYVSFWLKPTRKRIFIDVGGFDSFGVYRFDALLRIARSRQDLVVEAFRPLLDPGTDAAVVPETYRSIAAGEASIDSSSASGGSQIGGTVKP